MAQLFVISGPDIGKSFTAVDGLVLGRAPERGAQVRGPSVSRQHARLERTAGGWCIVDLKSSNGVFLGAARVEPGGRGRLEDGCTLRLGDVELRFRAQDESQGAPASSASSAPVERPRPKPAPAPAPELEDELELELEGDWSAPSVSPPAPRPAPKPAAPRPAKPQPKPAAQRSGAAAAAGAGARARGRGAATKEALTTGREVLQYARVEDRGGGFFSSDLGQYPGWVRTLAMLAVFALFGGLVYGAFRLTVASRSAPVELEVDDLVDDSDSWADED